MRHSIFPSLLSSGFGATILFGAGKPISKGSRSHMFYDVPFNAVTCLPVGLMSLDWPIDPFARFDFPDLRFLLRFPAADNNSVLFQLLYVPAGDRMLSKHHRS